MNSEVLSLRHLFVEEQQALKMQQGKNKEIGLQCDEVVRAGDQRIIDLERNLFCLKQEQRKQKLSSLLLRMFRTLVALQLLSGQDPCQSCAC